MDDTSGYAAAYEAASQALAEGDAQAAFQHLHGVLEYPGELADRGQWRDALALFGDIGEAVAGADFAAKVRAAAQDPDNPQALYDLGYELIEESLPRIAATVLARANTLAPDEESILTELVAALEHDGSHVLACWFLRNAPAILERSPFCRYLLAFNTIMTGDLAETRRQLAHLQPAQDENGTFLNGRIAGMLARADALAGVSPLDDRDLRGWHFVLTGAVLLHLSPYGFAEGMHGRYAYIHDSDALALEGIRRLAAVLAAWEIAVPRVFRLPDRDSAILATAAAQALERPLVPWPDGGSQDPGLIVAYDLAALPGDLLRTFAQHRPGQLLWSHAACWTVDQSFTADLTTHLYQFNHAPWGGGLAVDAETQEVRERPPSADSVESLAAQVLAARLEAAALADLPTLLALARAARPLTGYDAAAGAFCLAGPRRRQWAGSPVLSARFA